MNQADAQTPQLEDVLKKLKEIKPYMQEQWGITELAVFGSVARGEATPESDIDIMFDYSYPLGWEISDIGDYLEEQFSRKVDILSKKGIRPKIWSFIAEDMRYA
jgi:predicted nucleotidyltransferase